MNRIATMSLALTFTTIAPAIPVHADSIVLRRSVRMPGDRNALVMSDIATLEGAEAEALAELVVLDVADPTLLQTLSLEMIERALDGAGWHRGRIHLSGGDVIVRPRPQAGLSAPMPMHPAAIDSVPTLPSGAESVEWISAAAMIDEPTARGELARRIVAGLGEGPDNVRLRFEEHDQESALPISLESCQIEVDPMSSFTGDRLEFTLRFWRDGVLHRSARVTAYPEIRSGAVTLNRDLSRGEPIERSDLTEYIDWRPPTEARRSATRNEAIGQMAAMPLREGAVLRARDVAPPIAIERGERVTVRCLSGGVVITLQAEARSEGAVGDEIELRKIGERDTFLATVTGPHEAVVDLTRR